MPLTNGNKADDVEPILGETAGEPTDSSDRGEERKSESKQSREEPHADSSRVDGDGSDGHGTHDGDENGEDKGNVEGRASDVDADSVF